VKWFWIALGKFFDKRNAPRKEKPVTNIHWTRAEKPIGEMSKDERRDLAKKIAEGFLAQKNDEK